VLGFDAARGKELQRTLRGGDQAAAVPAHVEDQALFGKLFHQPPKLFDKLARLRDAKGEDAHVTQAP
jgi:hypothetical protein